MPKSVTVARGGARFIVEDVLGDALVRAGRVVVRLVLGQDGGQMPFAEDQHAVEQLTAQGAIRFRIPRVIALRALKPS